MYRVRAGWLTVLTVTCVATVSACSSPGSGEDTDGNDRTSVSTPAPVRSVPLRRDVRGLTLPLDAYQLNDSQRAQLTRATDLLISKCMKRFGMRYEFLRQEPLTSIDSSKARLYGVTDERTAALHGYHAPGAKAKEARKLQADAIHAAMSPTELFVFGGTRGERGQRIGSGQKNTPPTASPGKVGGQDVPPGGCSGEAGRAIYGARGIIGGVGLTSFADQIASDSYSRSLADDRVRGVFGKWSVCMKKKGYNYPDLKSLMAEPWATPAPTRKEIATAMADVACKAEVNVVGVWSAVHAAYQQAALEKNQVSLGKAKKDLDLALRNASQIITAG